MWKQEKTIVLGKGFLGKEFERCGFEVLGRNQFNWPTEDFSCLDGYEYIINCIGCADTRYCEKQENWRDIFDVNSNLVASLSQYCQTKGKKFVQISTGCVYDRNNIPQKETAFVSSHCKYVVSKLAAEYSCSKDDLIIRPRLYFSDKVDKNNLLSKISKFEKHLIEINSFTSTRTIVESVATLLFNSQSGVFNVAQDGYATIEQICKHLNIEKKPTIDGSQLILDQNIHLVNNILDIEKLKQFYQPRSLFSELERCWMQIKNL